MAVNARAFVAAPSKSLLGYGLFSVAEMRGEPTVNGRVDPHWKNGITWENVCPDANRTYDSCIADNSGAGDFGDPDAKAATTTRTSWGATPFTVLVEVDCSPPGFWEDADSIISQTFTEAEQWEVERTFSTGRVGGAAALALPHLQHPTGVVDDQGITLQLAVASVGPTGNTPLDVVEALGKLESSLSTCVKGVGVIHVPAELLPHLASAHLIDIRDGIYYSPAGHKISVSAAYQGNSPANAATADALWMYATGPVFIYRDRGKFVGDRTDSLDLSVNTLKRIFERTYVVGYDCCLFGVLVSTGGVTTGLPGSAF